MSDLTGTASMVRLVLRRDRVRLPVWIVALVGIVYLSAAAVRSTYRNQRQIDAYASTVGESPVGIAMGGPPVALDTIGGILVYETGFTALVGVALMAVFLTVRHTRGDEDEGRTELLRSTVLGRHAPAAAACLVVGGASALVGLGSAASLLTQEVPVEGAVVYGAAILALGVVFTTVALLAAQLMSHARGAVGVSLAVLGAAFLLRAIGDVGDGTLSWLSPMGWSQQVRAFDDNRWWPLLLSLTLAGALLGVATVLLSRRDLGSGVVPPRPGPADASRWLSGPVGLALRMQRGSIIGWSVGVFVGAAVFGAMSQELKELVDSNPAFAEYFAQSGGGSLTDAFFASALLIMALLASAFAVGSVLRGRGEESAGRLEPVLATGLSRTRWLLAGLAVTVLGATVVLLSAGLGVGLAHALVSGDAGAVLPLVGDALVYLPATLLVVGLTVLLFGFAPRLALLAWAVVGLYFVLGWLGGLLRPPAWLLDLSPFTHTPAVPAEELTVAPLVVLVLLAAAAAAAGLAAFRRRDVG
jgi:ABC-2 type transport system permease protein